MCAEKLADYKVIREVIVLDDMPRSNLDKISKVDLRGRLPAIYTQSSGQESVHVLRRANINPRHFTVNASGHAR